MAEFQQQVEAYQVMYDENQRALLTMEQEATREIIDRMVNLVQEIAQERELAMVFDNRPEVAAALLAYAGAEYQCIQASGAGVPGIERISANADTPNDCYVTDTVKLQAAAVAAALGANGFVFDASDLMPPAVGQGSFWTGMIDWTRGTSTADVTDSIENSWP